MKENVDFYIIFYVNKNGLYDFTVIKAVNLKDAFAVSKSFAKATKCKILGVCLNCFKSFKFYDGK